MIKIKNSSSSKSKPIDIIRLSKKYFFQNYILCVHRGLYNSLVGVPKYVTEDDHTLSFWDISSNFSSSVKILKRDIPKYFLKHLSL